MSAEKCDNIIFNDYELNAKDLAGIEKGVHSLRQIVNINARVLNILIKENHPLTASYLKKFIHGHNEQVEAITELSKVLDDMFLLLLKGGDEC